MVYFCIDNDRDINPLNTTTMTTRNIYAITVTKFENGEITLRYTETGCFSSLKKACNYLSDEPRYYELISMDNEGKDGMSVHLRCEDGTTMIKSVRSHLLF